MSQRCENMILSQNRTYLKRKRCRQRWIVERKKTHSFSWNQYHTFDAQRNNNNSTNEMKKCQRFRRVSYRIVYSIHWCVFFSSEWMKAKNTRTSKRVNERDEDWKKIFKSSENFSFFTSNVVEPGFLPNIEINSRINTNPNPNKSWNLFKCMNYISIRIRCIKHSDVRLMAAQRTHRNLNRKMKNKKTCENLSNDHIFNSNGWYLLCLTKCFHSSPVKGAFKLVGLSSNPCNWIFFGFKCGIH